IQMNVPYNPPGQTTVVFALVNAGKARIDGLEFEAQGVLGNLRLNGSLGIINGKFTGGPAVGSPFISGQTPPKYTWSISSDYTIPVPIGDVVLHADYAWTGKLIGYSTIKTFGNPLVFYSPAQIASITQRAHGVGNLRADLNMRDPNITLSAWIQNVA